MSVRPRTPHTFKHGSQPLPGAAPTTLAAAPTSGTAHGPTDGMSGGPTDGPMDDAATQGAARLALRNFVILMARQAARDAFLAAEPNQEPSI